jgi:hypothetical protein
MQEAHLLARERDRKELNRKIEVLQTEKRTEIQKEIA